MRSTFAGTGKVMKSYLDHLECTYCKATLSADARLAPARSVARSCTPGTT